MKTRHSLTLPVLMLSLAISACGSEGAGTGAGDANSASQAAADAALLAPFAGVYDLTGNWRGTAADAAMLVVRAADSDGTSAVLLLDIDDAVGNCTASTVQGVATVDRFTTEPRVFLDGIFDLDNGVLSLSANGTLEIDFSDVNDIDADGDSTDRVVFLAPPIGITEADVPAPC